MKDFVAKKTNNEATTSAPSSHLSVDDLIRLSTIQPSQFDRKLDDWFSFIYTFDALFHNNSALNDVVYITSRAMLQSLQRTSLRIFLLWPMADNYSVVYNELIRQYENTALMSSVLKSYSIATSNS